MKDIVVAIDGYSACGKSSTAKEVAKRLSYTFIDSGAMYRAVTLHLINQSVDLEDQNAVADALKDININFNGHSIELNGVNVDRDIRTSKVNQSVSVVSANSDVRTKLVSQQRTIGERKGVVMDGRDIGTVVFPNAELKIFMIAEMQVRALRRQKELNERGIDEPLESITQNLTERDHIDSTREDSPLRKADDAIEIDTTDISLEEQIEEVVRLAKEKINED